MPALQPVLNAIIQRISRKEIKANTGVIRRATAQYRHDIAALKTAVADLTQRLALVEKRTPKEVAPPPEVLEKGRFRAMGVHAHRAKLGLSGKNVRQTGGCVRTDHVQLGERQDQALVRLRRHGGWRSEAWASGRPWSGWAWRNRRRWRQGNPPHGRHGSGARSNRPLRK